MTNKVKTLPSAIQAFVEHYRKPLSKPVSIILSLLQAIQIDRPNAQLCLQLIRLIQDSRFEEALQLAPDPFEYSCYLDYLADAQAVALVKKYPNWNIERNPQVECYKTFIQCELTCMQTNSRLYSGNKRYSELNGIIYSAQRKILSILGESPDISKLPCKFGPGATYLIKRNTSALEKLGSGFDVTAECLDVFQDYLRTLPGWRPNEEFLEFFTGPPSPISARAHIVSGDRLSTVPKTALTDRPIAIGPTVNVLIQKGLGSVLRRRLRPYVDLNVCDRQHREFAKLGSIDNSICTIDLKSASDTISTALVETLLPGDWFKLLDAARSKCYEIDGKKYFYHKFSAMGNGFTFELESLLFYAITFACVDFLGADVSKVSVFGDDIVAPTEAYHLIKDVLCYLGFEVNAQKSFFKPGFRESCGGDYFHGHDVRPLFLKTELTSHFLVLLHNHLTCTYKMHVLPELYRLIKRLVTRPVWSYFRSPINMGGVFYDPTMPNGPFNFIHVRYSGLRMNRKVKTHGIAHLLYRNSKCYLEFQYNPYEYKTRRSRLTCSVRRQLYWDMHPEIGMFT